MIFKLLLLLGVFYSIVVAAPQFDWVADSVLISRTSIHRFERDHKQYDKTTLDYQIYIASIWPHIKEKVSQSFRNDLILSPVRMRNFINVLRSRNRHRDIVIFIELQRDVSGDNMAYWEHLVEAYINLKNMPSAQREIERVSLEEEANYHLLKNFMHRAYGGTEFCNDCFASFMPKKIDYNELRLLHFYYTKPSSLAQIISSQYSSSQYDDIIGEVIMLGIRDSLPPQKIRNIYSAAVERVERAFTERLKTAVFIYTGDFSGGYAIFDLMDKRMRGEFLDAFADSMFVKLGYKNFLNITSEVPVSLMGKKALRHLYAAYKLTNRQDEFMDRVLPNVVDRDIHSYFHFWQAFLMLTQQEGGEKYVEKYLTTRVGDVHYNDFLLWSTVVRGSSPEQRRQLNSFVKAFLTYDVKSALEYIDILKPQKVEYEILLSFSESELRKVQYSYSDIARWYNALKHIDSGRFLMLLSEQFFSEEDLHRFYKRKLDTETDSLWQSFIGSRLAELGSPN